LECVAVQRQRDLEIIIGDDASTDDTIAKALQFMPEIQVVKLPVNRGAAAARNAAMRRAGGKFLAFLDSDDEWLPGKLELQLAYLRDHPECAVCATPGMAVTVSSPEKIRLAGRIGAGSCIQRRVFMGQARRWCAGPFLKASAFRMKN